MYHLNLDAVNKNNENVHKWWIILLIVFKMDSFVQFKTLVVAVKK